MSDERKCETILHVNGGVCAAKENDESYNEMCSVLAEESKDLVWSRFEGTANQDYCRLV